MKKVLIAGCGYVGGVLAQELATAGHEVWALRRSLPATGGKGPIHWVSGDVSTPEGLAALPADFDAAYYLVGADGHSPDAYRRAYVDGPGNLAAHLARQTGPPARLYFVSSTGVYGQNDGEWVDESSPTDARSFSGQILLEGEELLRGLAAPLTVVRFSGIYGPGRERMIESVRNGTEVLRAGDDRVVNHIHRDDCAGFLAHLLTLAEPDGLYIGSDNEPASRLEMMTWIAETLKIPAPQVTADPPEAAQGARGGRRYYANRKMRSTGYELRYPGYREGYGALIAARKGNPST